MTVNREWGAQQKCVRGCVGPQRGWGHVSHPELTRFLGNALFSLRPWRVSLDGECPADKLVSMCSAFSMSKASNFSMT